MGAQRMNDLTPFQKWTFGLLFLALAIDVVFVVIRVGF